MCLAAQLFSQGYQVSSMAATQGYIVYNVTLYMQINMHEQSIVYNVTLYMQINMHEQSIVYNVTLYMQINMHEQSS